MVALHRDLADDQPRWKFNHREAEQRAFGIGPEFYQFGAGAVAIAATHDTAHCACSVRGTSQWTSFTGINGTEDENRPSPMDIFPPNDGGVILSSHLSVP